MINTINSTNSGQSQAKISNDIARADFRKRFNPIIAALNERKLSEYSPNQLIKIGQKCVELLKECIKLGEPIFEWELLLIKDLRIKLYDHSAGPAIEYVVTNNEQASGYSNRAYQIRSILNEFTSVLKRYGSLR